MINCLTKDHHDRIWDNQIVLTIDGTAFCYYSTKTKTISDLQTDVCINKWEKWEVECNEKYNTHLNATYSCTNYFGIFIITLSIDEVTIMLENKNVYKKNIYRGKYR